MINKIANPSHMTGNDGVIQDLPKISLAPKPNEPTIWSAYLVDGKLRARLHVPGKFNQIWFDGEINNPENFVEVCLAWRNK